MIRILTTTALDGMLQAAAAVARSGERARAGAEVGMLRARLHDAERRAQAAETTLANLPSQIARPYRRLQQLRAETARLRDEVAHLEQVAARRQPLALPPGPASSDRPPVPVVTLGRRAWGPTGQPPAPAA